MLQYANIAILLQVLLLSINGVDLLSGRCYLLTFNMVIKLMLNLGKSI